jgi:hypothetical protein
MKLTLLFPALCTASPLPIFVTDPDSTTTRITTLFLQGECVKEWGKSSGAWHNSNMPLI